MRKIPRRSLLRGTLAAVVAGVRRDGVLAGVSVATPRATDIRIEDVSTSYEDFPYRTPLKFGGVATDRVTVLNVECAVRTAGGRLAKGFGSMPMGNVWSFPSKRLPYETTLRAMKGLAERIRKITADYHEPGHPIDINRAVDPAYLLAAEEVAREQKLSEPIPKLCALVTASAFDAALHDAFGKAHGLNCYRTYGPDFLAYDLAHYLGPRFRGEHLDRYIQEQPKARMPVYHLVGALDPIVDSDIHRRVNDGLPETLPEWIQADGITHLKIKLNGNDLAWDVDRVARIHRATAETEEKRGIGEWVYSLDFNEQCPNVAYLLDFFHRLKATAPGAFERIQYVEQPTARDLKTHRENDMHEASKVKPVVIDESLTDLESLMLAREMGYTGAALKACKGQSQSMLMAAVGQKYKMFLTVQDLTCPGASLIQSAGIAAHVPGMAAIEANSRQYVPAANRGWVDRFPGIFRIKNGMMETGILTGPGLGAVP